MSRPYVKMAGAMEFPVKTIDMRFVRKTLTTTLTPMGEEPQEIEAFFVEGDTVVVPRQFGITYCRERGIEYVDATTPGEDAHFPRIPDPREYQVPFIDDLVRCSESYYDFMARAHTGFGKTISSLIWAARLGRTTLIVVDQDNLKEQWVKALVKHFGMAVEDIGIIQGQEVRYEGCAVTIAMVQTLTSRTLPDETYAYFGTIIFDEVHVMGAPVYNLALYAFPAMYRLGVSATPRRKDNGQKLLDWHLGVVRVAADKEHEESNVYFRKCHSVYSWYANISPKVGRWITEISEDGARNLEMAESILWMYGTGRDLLVISDRIEQLKHVRSLCYYLGLPMEDMGLYTGYDPSYQFAKNKVVARRPKHHVRGTEYTPIGLQSIAKRIANKTLEDILATKRVIFATYGKFQKGVDVPRLSGGISISPRSSSEQTHGRILREEDGKIKPLWIDPVEWNNPRAIHGFLQRLTDYVKRNNSVIYEWLEEGGVERWELDDLVAEARARKKELDQRRIVQLSNGLYTLATQHVVKQNKARDVLDTIKQIRERTRSGEASAPRARTVRSAAPTSTSRTPLRRTPSRKLPPR